MTTSSYSKPNANIETLHRGLLDETVDSDAQVGRSETRPFQPDLETSLDEKDFRVCQILHADPVFASFTALDSSGKMNWLHTISLRFLDHWNLRILVDGELSRYLHLNHPNILTPRTVRRWNDSHKYYRLPNLLNHSLAQWMALKPHLELPAILEILGQLLNALGYAHKQNVLHRHLRPDQIFLGPDGRIRISNFGMIYDGRLQHGLIEPREACFFTSPETERNLPERVDQRSDIYSVGRILEWLLLHADLPERLALRLSAVARKASSRSRSLRFQSCLQLRTAISEAVEAGSAKCFAALTH